MIWKPMLKSSEYGFLHHFSIRLMNSVENILRMETSNLSHRAIEKKSLGGLLHGRWSDGGRDNPQPCKEGDNGKFEIVARDGRKRIGKLPRSMLETPALLPVINPNIRTIEPREMWIDMAFKV